MMYVNFIDSLYREGHGMNPLSALAKPWSYGHFTLTLCSLSFTVMTV